MKHVDVKKHARTQAIEINTETRSVGRTSNGDTAIICAHAVGAFPPYEHVIPKELAPKLTPRFSFQADVLNDAIAAFMIVANTGKRSPSIRIEPTEDEKNPFIITSPNLDKAMVLVMPYIEGVPYKREPTISLLDRYRKKIA